MSYGIVFSDTSVGRLRAKGFKAGICPDSVILSGRGDAFVEDSTFQFSLNLTAARGGRIELDLRQGEPVSRVFDGKILRDPEAQLELRTSRCRTSGGSSSVTALCRSDKDLGA